MTYYILAAVGIVILIALFVTYNSLVALRNKANEAYSTMDVFLQKRFDLIPNLVATVKGYAEHEQETFEAVVAARAKATQVTVNDLSEESVQKFQQAQGEVSSALGRLLAVVENYPDLKANENFLDLQAQLEGTENRIAEARRAFNETAKTYNTQVRSFPANLIASAFGFSTKGYFTADESASQAPKVEF